MSTSQKPRRVLARLGVVAVAALAATGCVKIDGDFTVRANDTVDGTMIVAVDKDAASMMGDQFSPSSLRGEMDEPKDQASITKWSNDTFTGSKITYDGASLTDFNESSTAENGLKIRHEGDRYVLTGAMDMSQAGKSGGGGEIGSMFAKEMMADARMRMRFTFPGKVIETNGTVGEDGRTVTFKPKMGERNQARVVADDGAEFPWIPASLLAGGGLIFAGAAVGLVRRRRS